MQVDSLIQAVREAATINQVVAVFRVGSGQTVVQALSGAGFDVSELPTNLKRDKRFIVSQRGKVNSSVVLRQSSGRFEVMQDSADDGFNKAVSDVLAAFDAVEMVDRMGAAGATSDRGEYDAAPFRRIPDSVSRKPVKEFEGGDLAIVYGVMRNNEPYKGVLRLKRMTGQRKSLFDVLLHIKGERPIKFAVAREEMTVSELAENIEIDDKETKLDFSILDSSAAPAEPETPADLLGGQPTAFTIIPEGRDNQVKTAKGTKVSTKFAVVEVSDLIVSHDEQGGENPLYPQVLQPRDRGRTSSQVWVQKTSRDLDPDMLGRTRRADTGAPIVGPDGIVESGNGRTMAIRAAYKEGRAGEYREWLMEEAPVFGLNPEKIKAMREPVLVRVRTSEVDRAAFAVEANQDDKLSMTATEKARSDARRLTPELMERFNPGANGDLLAASNRDFLRGFLESLGDAEAAQYVTSKGQPTGTLIARVQAAIFAKAYEDERLLELMADTAKPEIQNIITALNAAAPEFIKAKNESKAGATEAAEKLADGIELSLDEQAVKAVIDATNVVRAAREANMQVHEYVAQMGLFGDVPADVAAVAIFISQNNRSSKRMAVAFKAMAEFVHEEMVRGQNFDMFGERQVDMLQVIEAANRAIEREYGEGQFAISTPTPELAPGGLFESARYGSVETGFFQ